MAGNICKYDSPHSIGWVGRHDLRDPWKALTRLKFNQASSVVNQWVADQNYGAAYRLMDIAASVAGNRGVAVVSQKSFNRFIWDSEKALYRSAGFLRNLLKGSDGRG